MAQPGLAELGFKVKQLLLFGGLEHGFYDFHILGIS